MSKNLTDIYVGVNKSDENRRENDLYETPPLATYVLHKYVELPERIIEPCAGRGNIAVELTRCGYEVLAFDLNTYDNMHFPVRTGQDVLTLDCQENYDALITNPPYFKDLPRKILEKGLNEYRLTALLVRLTFLEGLKRSKIFRKHKPSQIIFFSDRIKFEKNLIEEPIAKEEQIGGMIAYMWIVFDLSNTSNTTKLDWISLSDEFEEWEKHYKEKTK